MIQFKQTQFWPLKSSALDTHLFVLCIPPRETLPDAHNKHFVFSHFLQRKEKNVRSFRRHKQQNKREWVAKMRRRNLKKHITSALIYIPGHKEFSLHIVLTGIDISFYAELF